MKKNPTKAVRLSAHANLCRDLPLDSSSFARALDLVLARLRHLKVPPVERLGPAPSAESIVAEIRAHVAARRARIAKAKKSAGMDSFVVYAWNHIRPETRAMLVASPGAEGTAGDYETRLFARSVRDLLTPQDFESFLDEIVRS